MFKNNIERSIGKVLKDNKHNVIHIAKHCSYFMKRFSDKLAFYVRCSDNRHHNGAIEIRIFFTAIQLPDDGLTSFNAGMDIHILTLYSDITDEIMIAAGEKIVAIENSIGSAADIILAEIEKPYFQSKQLQVFKKTLLIYDTFSKDESLQEKFDSLKSEVCKLVKRKKNVEIYQLCSDFVDSLPTEYLKKKEINLEVNRIKNILAEQLYAQCILDI